MAMVFHVKIIFRCMWLQKLAKIEVISTSSHNRLNTKLFIFTSYVNRDIPMHFFCFTRKIQAWYASPSNNYLSVAKYFKATDTYLYLYFSVF